MNADKLAFWKSGKDETKAISAKENTILLVCLSGFGVAPAVAELAMRLLTRLEAKQKSGIFFSGNRLTARKKLWDRSSIDVPCHARRP